MDRGINGLGIGESWGILGDLGGILRDLEGSWGLWGILVDLREGVKKKQLNL